MKAEVKTLDASSAGEIELADDVFGLEPRGDILHRTVTWQLAKRRAGTHKVKQRSEIAGSTRKIVRQKGSGGARHGNRKSNVFVGGGVVHGPVVRSHAHDLPKKIRKLALKHALSSKLKDGKLVIVDAAALSAPKTKDAKDALAKLGLKGALFIDGTETNDNFALAIRNIPYVDVLPSQGANVYDILRADTLVVTKAGVEALEARLK